MNKTLHALLFAFIALGSTALVAQTSALSVEKIMQDPKWMGTFPDRINWGPQSKTIYFNYNPEENPSDSLYKIEVSNLYSGVYIMYVIFSDGSHKSTKLVVRK